VPFLGESYEYTKDFDVIALNASLVAKIRAGKLIELIAIGDYSYEAIAVINENGFGINLASNKDLLAYIIEYEKKGINDIFANKWLDFTKYRTIKFRDSIE